MDAGKGRVAAAEEAQQHTLSITHSAQRRGEICSLAQKIEGLATIPARPPAAPGKKTREAAGRAGKREGPPFFFGGRGGEGGT